MNEKAKGISTLLVSITLMAIAGSLAKLIPFPAYVLIFARMAIAAPCVLLFIYIRGNSVLLRSKRDIVIFVLLGILLTMHWVSYFSAVQISTVAIATIAVFVNPILTTFVEPFFHKERIRLIDAGTAVLAFVGIVVMIDDFSLVSTTLQGVALGLFSALCISLRNVISRNYVRSYSGPIVMFYQLTTGAVLLSPILLVVDITLTTQSALQLLVLGIVATAMGHTLLLVSMTHLSARTVGVLSSVQIIMVVLVAFVLLGEVPSLRSVIGGIIILSAVVSETLQHTKKPRATAKP